MPKPTATSAAAIAIEKSTNTWPCALLILLENAIRFRFAALAIISMENIIRMAFRLTTIPYTPIETSIKDTIMYSTSSVIFLANVLPAC